MTWRWSAAVDLYAARRAGWWDSGVALTQAPSGRRLVAWAGKRDVRVDVEGEPTTAVAEPGPVDSITCALADDGSAVVVFQSATRLFAVDRGPGGPWSKPHPLSRPALTLPDLVDIAQVNVASGGRALVTWPLEDGRVVAASGHAGGRWGPPTPVSAPSVPQPAPEAPNVPSPRLADGRIVWIELARRHPGQPSTGTLRIR